MPIQTEKRTKGKRELFTDVVLKASKRFFSLLLQIQLSIQRKHDHGFQSVAPSSLRYPPVSNLARPQVPQNCVASVVLCALRDLK